MRRWAWIIVGLYTAMLFAFTVPLTIIAFAPFSKTFAVSIKEFCTNLLSFWPYWIWICVMMLSQISLLLIPVGVSNSRPLTRRHIIWPVLMASLMLAMLIAAFFLLMMELILRNPFVTWVWWCCLGILIFFWLFWGYIFSQWSKKQDPKNLITKFCRTLFIGSILELLIAVPAHIFARSKDYCCAGCSTFIGLTFGLAIMFLSFGPGIFFLYKERWERLQKKKTDK